MFRKLNRIKFCFFFALLFKNLKENNFGKSWIHRLIHRLNGVLLSNLQVEWAKLEIGHRCQTTSYMMVMVVKDICKITLSVPLNSAQYGGSVFPFLIFFIEIALKSCVCMTKRLVQNIGPKRLHIRSLNLIFLKIYVAKIFKYYLPKNLLL